MPDKNKLAITRRVYIVVAAVFLMLALFALAMAHPLLFILCILVAAITGSIGLSLKVRDVRLSQQDKDQAAPRPDGTANNGYRDRDTKESRNLVLIATAIGVLALLLYAFSQGTPAALAQGNWDVTLRVCVKLVGTLVLEAGAAFSFGALVGFLFGIPRSLQGKPTQVTRPAATGAPGTKDPASTASDKPEAMRAAGEAGYGSNTNLEEISDWLTKIIVGLGLINLKLIPGQLRAVAWYFSVFADLKIPEGISMSALIYFSVCGFFFAYLLTRLALPAAFSRADRAALLDTFAQLTEKATSAVSDMKSKMEYLVPQMDVIRAKDLVASIERLTGPEKQASILRTKELIPKMEQHSRNFPTLRTLHIVLGNLYYAAGDTGSATSVLERYLNSLEQSSQGISEDAAAALYNLACYNSEQSAIATGAARDEMLRKAADYLEKSLDVAKKAGQDIFAATLGLARTEGDLDPLRKSNLIELNNR
jgi:hypothetical protein